MKVYGRVVVVVVVVVVVCVCVCVCGSSNIETARFAWLRPRGKQTHAVRLDASAHAQETTRY